MKTSRGATARGLAAQDSRAIRMVVAGAIEPQFFAALDMLGRAVKACPERLWAERDASPQFWYVAFHTLFYADLYLFGNQRSFAPPVPFGLEELDPAGTMPPRVYSKAELRAYLAHCRARARKAFDSLTTERATASGRFGWGGKRYLELLVYNQRHIQHHAGQLNMMLRQGGARVPRWVFGTAKP